MWRVIFPDFVEGKYFFTGDLYLNNHCSPTISTPQTKVNAMRNIFQHQNDTNAVAVMKLQVSEVRSEVQKCKYLANFIENWGVQ